MGARLYIKLFKSSKLNSMYFGESPFLLQHQMSVLSKRAVYYRLVSYKLLDLK